MTRCVWAADADALMVRYHDEEWGRPVHEDRLLFEFLILEGAQAGLSWATILKKREAYREAFDGFDASIVARYGPRKVKQTAGECRHRAQSAQDRGGHPERQGLPGRATRVRELRRLPLAVRRRDAKVNRRRALAQVPAKTPESDALSKDLAKRGFTFVGSTICYAFMQAVGLVNDHQTNCFRYRQLR